MQSRYCFPFALLFLLTCFVCFASEPYCVFTGQGEGASHKKIVLVSGDEEYRSEEELTQLARILATRHGFDCTVLYAIDPATGFITPSVLDNIPGLEALDQADLVVMAIRFRGLPDEQMRQIERYLKRGGPILALRTTTHAFKFPKESRWARYSWKYAGDQLDWTDGFGRKFLGETWIAHHGNHGKEGTRTVVAPDMQNHLILKGVDTINLPSDVYRVRLPLPGDSKPVLLGQIIDGQDKNAQPVQDGRNDPMMPVCWTKTYSFDATCPTGHAVVSTMGCSQDLLDENFRRMLVNAAYTLLGMEKSIPAKANVELVGPYHPTPFGYNKFQSGIKPGERF